MADLAYRILSESEIAQALKESPHWSRVADEIVRHFEFKTYANGALFLSAVACIADALDHHPDLLLGYKKLTVRVSTHSVKGLSPYDFELAKRIDALKG